MASKGDLIDVASKEVGYREGAGNKTKYGVYTGTNGLAWCHAFVSWCAKQAGIGTNIVPKTASTSYGMTWYRNKKRFGEKGKYTPQRNDLIYFKSAGASHVGIVEKVVGNTVYTIEGNSSDAVRRKSYALSYATITGYGKVHDYITNSYKPSGTADNAKKKSTEEELKALRGVLERSKKATKPAKTTFQIASVKTTAALKITLFFTHNKKKWNIVAQDGMTVTWKRKGTPGVLQFTTIIDTKHKIHNGDSVNLLVNGKPFFYGFVFKLKPSQDDTLEVTVYDQLRYLKNKDTKIYKKTTATKLIRSVAKSAGLKVGTLADTKRQLTRKEDNKTYFDMIENALLETVAMTGKTYILYDEYGKLRLREPWKVNILIDKETGQSYNYSNSIDSQTYNQIKLAYENKDKGTLDTYIAKSSKSINKWGTLQYFEKTDSPKTAKLKGKTLLQLYNRETRTLSISGALGDYRVKAGCLLPVIMTLYDTKVSSYLIVDQVKHRFENGVHTMDIDLSGGVFDATE